MKDFIFQLQNPEKAWQNFLKFDTLITETMIRESQENNISVCSRSEAEKVDEFAKKIATRLGIR